MRSLLTPHALSVTAGARGTRGFVSLAASLLIILVVTITPRAEPTLPRFDWTLSSSPREIVEGLLNAVLFAPLGVSFRWLRLGVALAITIGFLVSLAVELLQRFAIHGREGELQDLISNTIGALLGWLLAERLSRNA
jgi:VanZ family protein